MKIYFQQESFDQSSILDNFSRKNKTSGSIISFIGKVRELREKQKIKNIEIEFYKNMAFFQAEKSLKNLEKKITVDDYLIFHRYGKLFPGENIILVLVASQHRKEGFEFTQEVILYFKKKITFWKKEIFLHNSKWVEN
ncbi:MAG: molybdenum cofactor biosynthesis protein MoaE [Alphaproteobacteria bacterium]